jgi:Fe-S cluster biogenesis protein NfuA
MSTVTLKQGVEVAIQKAVPEIHTILDTTDHAAGTNPYYRATAGASPFA